MISLGQIGRARRPCRRRCIREARRCWGSWALTVRRVLDAWGAGPGHVFNLGHGITPEVPPEHVEVLVDTVHEHSRELHAASA